MNASGPPRPARAALVVAALGLQACAAVPASEEDAENASPLAVQETRVIDLRYLEMNVQNFQRTLTLADLRSVPRPVLDDIWLMDLDLTGFVDNALAQVAALPPESQTDQAARNLQRLITMTPNNVLMDGTSMEPLVDLSRAIGIAPQDATSPLDKTYLNAEITFIRLDTEVPPFSDIHAGGIRANRLAYSALEPSTIVL